MSGFNIIYCINYGCLFILVQFIRHVFGLLLYGGYPILVYILKELMA